MLTQEEQVFFTILQSVLWGKSCEVPADTSWQDLLQLAARQSCLHAFGMWMQAQRIQSPLTQQLQPTLFQTLQRQARLNHLTAEVIQLLTQHQIPATLIKGYSLSARYPDPDMRQYGDVDIYVGEANYHRAAEILTQTYANAYWHSDIRGGIHYSIVLDEHIDRVVELHRVTMELVDRRANQLFQAFTQRYLEPASCSIEVCGRRVSVPPAAYNGLYVFMHAWHHFESSGVGFRQLGDWALCLQHAHEELSAEAWQALTDEYDQLLQAMKMKTIWQTFGHILVDYLQLPACAFPLYTSRYHRRAKRLLRQLLRDGHGGRPALFQKVSKGKSVREKIQEIALMRRFPYERPEKHRVLQVGYTCCRLVFEAIQMAKSFPSQAWHELKHSLLLGTKKHT